LFCVEDASEVDDTLLLGIGVSLFSALRSWTFIQQYVIKDRSALPQN